jgi:hypothetical protein
MIYNKTTHRWSLEISDTEDVGNIVAEYGSVENANRALKSQSKTVYLYIYNRIPRQNKDIIELTLAKDPRYTPILKEALLSQLEYDLTSGGNDVNKQTGVNFVGGGLIPRSLQKERQVGIEVEQLLENAGSDVNLLYGGDFGVRLDDDRYTKYDY